MDELVLTVFDMDDAHRAATLRVLAQHLSEYHRWQIGGEFHQLCMSLCSPGGKYAAACSWPYAAATNAAISIISLEVVWSNVKIQARPARTLPSPTAQDAGLRAPFFSTASKSYSNRVPRIESI